MRIDLGIIWNLNNSHKIYCILHNRLKIHWYCCVHLKLLTNYLLRLVGVKIGSMEKEERKIEEKMMFSLVWFRRENTKDGKHWEKNPPGPTNFYPPDLGGKLGRKERKGRLSSWITYLPLSKLMSYM